MHLFFDTETTGLPRNYQAPVSDSRNWPRLVQLAWLVTDDRGTEFKSVQYIIKPQGFTIPREAARIHGITTAEARRRGVELGMVLAEIGEDLVQARILIAHNLDFDEKIVGAEFFRLGQPNHLEMKQKRCTMKSATEFCRIPGYYGYKWPRLEELHCILFGEDFEDQHTALADVRACARCYFELRRRGIL